MFSIVCMIVLQICFVEINRLLKNQYYIHNDSFMFIRGVNHGGGRMNGGGGLCNVNVI